MAPFYKFAVVSLAPVDLRHERLNLAVVIFTDESVDVRISRRLEKVRVLSAAIDILDLRILLESIADLDQRIRDSGVQEIEKRRSLLAKFGPLVLSKLGTFVAPTIAAYEARVASIFRAMIDAEPSAPRIKEKRSKLITQLKKAFRDERVMARKEETIDSHRVVSSYELQEGLVADMVLRNGKIHVIETVDASADDDSSRRILGEIGISALVLESARMKFGQDQISARLVYSASPQLERVTKPSLEAAAHQGTELVNWASADDRLKFIHTISSLAVPLERKRKLRNGPIGGRSSGMGFI